MPCTRASFNLDLANPLAGAAVELLVEALGIEGVRRSGNAGQNRQSDDGRKDGLHDQSPHFLAGGAVSLHKGEMVSLTGDDKQCSRTGDMKKCLAMCEFFSCASIRLRPLVLRHTRRLLMAG